MSTMDEQQKTPAAAMPEVTFDEFAVPTYDDWKEEAVTSLKGGVFEKKLFTKTYEGIQLEPIYTLEHTQNLSHPLSYPGAASFLRGTRAGGYLSHPWQIAQGCDEPEPQKCNEVIKEELHKGSTSIHVVLDTATLKGLDADSADIQKEYRGVSVSTIQDCDALLADVDLTLHDVHMYTGASPVMMLGVVGALCKAHGQPCDKLSGCIGADPLGVLAGEGTLPCPLDELYDEMAHATAWADSHMPAMRTVLVQGDVYHNGGANAVQEIAYAMNAAIAYIRAMQIRGLDIDMIARHIRFSFSLGSNFFMEIAKLRAARMIWAQIVEAFSGGPEAQKMNVHARTSFFSKTVYDPYVNMLRTTTEAFSGVVGGADSLQVGCFDEAVRPGDEFSRRIARNTQIMLRSEFSLLQPIDPAGGSWYIETLTHQIAEKVWTLLQKVEEQGGLAKALATGFIQQSIEEVLKQRLKNLASRSDRAVGTNMYPNTGEIPLEVPQDDHETVRKRRVQAIHEYRSEIDEPYCGEQLAKLLDAVSGQAGQLMDAVIGAFQAGATVGEIRSALNDDEPSDQAVQPIAVHRWTEQFETLRSHTEDYKTSTGDNVKIFLANMGKIPQHKPRADFTTGFMEVGAFEVLKNDGFPTVEEAAEAALKSGADAVVICSTDDTYPELVPPLAKMIKSGRPAMTVILAGAPAPEYESQYREAGVEMFIHVRANCYQILTELQRRKGML